MLSFTILTLLSRVSFRMPATPRINTSVIVWLLVLVGGIVGFTRSDERVQRPLIVAHRGLLLESPENTIPNFRACLELGLGFELDVQRTKDNRLVCIHDTTVDRTTNGKGSVSDLTLKQIRLLDAGSWFAPAFKGVRIPTVDQIFRLLAEYPDARVLIAVDLKLIEGEAEKELVKLARKHSVLDRLLFIGNTILDKDVRRRLYRADPSTNIAHVAHDSEELVHSMADPIANWVYVRYLPSKAEVAKIHKTRKRVFIAGKTVSGHEMENWHTAWAIGMDAILTDYSLELARYLRQSSE